MECDKCMGSRVERTESIHDGRNYLHCADPMAGHRCGWVVKISAADGRFGDCPAPAWCPRRV